MPPYVYIMSSATGVLYVGVTNDVLRRAAEHAAGIGCTFTARYNCNRLVYVERQATFPAAFVRETQLKSWRREKKVALINSTNPHWKNLLNPDDRTIQFLNKPPDTPGTD